MNKPYGEYRGCTNLVYAEILEDSALNYTVGEVKDLAGVSQVAVTTEQSTETKYYDNSPAFNINGVGAETRTFSIDHLDLATLGEITGQYVDSNGALISGSDGAAVKYFAVGYVSEVTNGVKTYKWGLRGTFAIPDETNITKNSGTDANGAELVYTGVKTIHSFANGGRATSVQLEDSFRDMSTWFNTVQTPDTLSSFTQAFTVTYNGNGNTGGTIPVQQTSTGLSVTLAAGTGMVKGTKAIESWNTNPAGTGTSYELSEAITLPAFRNLVLYAIYEA